MNEFFNRLVSFLTAPETLMSVLRFIAAIVIILVGCKLVKIFTKKIIEFKEPTTLLIVSLFLGTLGIDRFMLKDTGIGILKLLTSGCCGILTIIDWFTVQKKAKEKNFNDLMMML